MSYHTNRKTGRVFRTHIGDFMAGWSTIETWQSEDFAKERAHEYVQKFGGEVRVISEPSHGRDFYSVQVKRAK